MLAACASWVLLCSCQISRWNHDSLQLCERQPASTAQTAQPAYSNTRWPHAHCKVRLVCARLESTDCRHTFLVVCVLWHSPSHSQSLFTFVRVELIQCSPMQLILAPLLHGPMHCRVKASIGTLPPRRSGKWPAVHVRGASVDEAIGVKRIDSSPLAARAGWRYDSRFHFNQASSPQL